MGIKIAALLLVLEGQRPGWIADVLGSLALNTASGTATLSCTNGAGESGSNIPLTLTKLTDPNNAGVFSGMVWFSAYFPSANFSLEPYQ